MFYGIVFAIVLGAGVANAAPLATPCGDVDLNGTLSASDALRVLKAAVGLPVTVSCPICAQCWDTNGNANCDEEEDLNGDGVCTQSDCPP